jgi:exonuclease III
MKALRQQMLTYTSAELRLLSVDGCPPQRAVRKKLFTLHLWRPARRRQLAWQSLQRTIKTKTTLAGRPPSINIGWLNAQSMRNKTDCIQTAITDRSLDVLPLYETWHSGSDDNCLRLATPPGYAVVDSARSSGRGGGVAVIFRNNWKSALLTLPVCNTFEALAVQLTLGAQLIIILVIYRPGSEKVCSLFFDELSAVLETLVVFSCPVIIGGDFNIKVNLTEDASARRLSELLACFDMVQHVKGPTHCRGNTLDLVITPSGWFDAECRAKRRECRMLERRYRRSRSTTDCRAWVDATRARFRLLRSKKEEYWLSRLEACGKSSMKIWKTMSPLLGRNRDVTSSTSHTADGFAVYALTQRALRHHRSLKLHHRRSQHSERVRKKMCARL